MTKQLLERLDKAIVHFSPRTRYRGRSSPYQASGFSDDDTRKLLEDAAAEIRKYQQAGERLMKPRRGETVYD